MKAALEKAVLAGMALILAAGSGICGSRNEIVEGNPASPVRVLIYDDLQCSDCTRFRTLLDERILPKYGARVAFVHRDFPLGKHEWARAAAIAGRWVYENDHALGITFRRELMAEQDGITAQSLKPWLLEFAARNKLDQKGILDSLSDQRLSTQVDQDRQAGVARGISRTPTALVGGQAFVETIVYDDLARALDEALAK
jgi:protein-disulfide isomerase